MLIEVALPAPKTYPRYRIRHRRALWVVDLVASPAQDADRENDGLVLGTSIRKEDAIQEATAKLKLTPTPGV